MATELGKAYVQIVPSAQGISGAIKDALGGSAMDNAGKSAGGKLAASIKKAIAAAGIGKFLADTIKEGARYEQARGGIETLFGAKGAKSVEEYASIVKKSVGEVQGEYTRLKGVETQMMKNANNAWKTAGISANEYMEQSTSFAAALLQSVGGSQEKAAAAAHQAVVDMADNANKFGTNLQDIQNAYQGFAKQNYTMLDNLKLGYGGTKTEMERLLADAEKISGIHYDISNLDDVYSAIHVIQEEMGVTGTTAKEAATTLSGSFSAMKSAFSNFKAQLVMGEDVKGAFKGLAEAATTFLMGNLLPAIGSVLKNLPLIFTTSLGDVHKTVIDGIKNATNAAKENLPGMIEAFMEGFMKFSTSARAHAGKMVDVGLKLIKAVAEGIIKNIPTFIKTVPTIISNFANIINDNAPKIMMTGLSILKSLAIGLVKAIPVLIQNIPLIIKALWDAFMAFQWLNLGKSLITGIKDGIASMKGSITEAGKSIIDGIKGVFTGGWTSIKGTASSAWNSIKSIATSAWNGIKSAITSPINTAMSTVRGALNKIKSFFPLSIGRIFSNLKIPKINVSGGKAPFGIGGKGKVPKFSVQWNAKGGVYDAASIIGIGVGESGREIVTPEALMRQVMDESNSDLLGKLGNQSGNIDYKKMAAAIVEALASVELTSVLDVDGKALARNTAPLIQRELSTLETRNNRKLGLI